MSAMKKSTPLRNFYLPPAEGMFGAQRKHDVHTGIDLYAPVGTEVMAIYDGEVIGVENFTGPEVGSPWWNTTQAVYIVHPVNRVAEVVVVYGEISPIVKVGQRVLSGQVIGHVQQVLKKDKGKPMSMLHLENYVVRPSGSPIDYSTFKPVDNYKISSEDRFCLTTPNFLLNQELPLDYYKPGMVFVDLVNWKTFIVLHAEMAYYGIGIISRTKSITVMDVQSSQKETYAWASPSNLLYCDGKVLQAKDNW